MKSFDQLISERRSVRKYLDKEIESEKLEAVLEAARLAPSACNAQPWRFVVVRDRELINKVVTEGMGGVVSNSWAKTSPVIIAACSDLDFVTHHLGEQVQDVHYHLIDIGIAMEHIVLKATELNLGTCYIGWFRGKEIKRILNIPSLWKVECLLTIGYPADVPKASKRKFLQEIVVFK